MFNYFYLSKGHAQELADKYAEEVGKDRQRQLGEYLAQSGANGFAFGRQWGYPLMVHGLTYEAGHDIFSMEGVIAEPTDEEDGSLTVTVDPSTDFGQQYTATIARINEELKGKPDISDWLTAELKVIGYALGPRKENGGHDKLATHFYRGRKGGLFFQVPIGNEYQQTVQPDARLIEISPNRYKQGV